MQSFESHEAGAGNTQVSVPNSIASHAAAGLALSDHQLHKFWAFPVCLVLATSLVDLIDLIMAASEAGEAFETHLGLLVDSVWSC